MAEESEETLISPTGGTIFRKPHFLKPTTTAAAAVEAPPPPPPPPYSLKYKDKYKDLPFQINFCKLTYPPTTWETWVHQMHALHHLTWKKAGILNAIMSSTSIIRRNDILLYGFVEKWCAVTNSFVFPWGEATVTLEDMLVIGGYSVLGDSVFISPNDDESRELVEKLAAACSILRKTRAKKVAHCAWMSRFMDSGSEIEHQAFLVYWLSRFVFPMNSIRGGKVLSIAVRLSRGVKIALAPAVLAVIYRDMSLLKAAITAARIMGNSDKVLEIKVSAPLALVQVWIWERFPDLRPKPNLIKPSTARIARWHNLTRKVGMEDLSLGIENFEWRPYMNDHAGSSSFHGKIYADSEYWVSLVETELDEAYEWLIRCLRTSELVGLESGCIEQYLPHRVAMQFGMDQDLPGYIARENRSREIAWNSYNRPILDKTVYIPPRVLEPGVTTRYLEWWNEIINSSKRIFVESSSSRKRVAQSSTRESYDVQGRIRLSYAEDDGRFHYKLTSLLPKHEVSNVEINTLLIEKGKDQCIDGYHIDGSLFDTKAIGLRLEERIIVLEKLCDLMETGN